MSKSIGKNDKNNKPEFIKENGKNNKPEFIKKNGKNNKPEFIKENGKNNKPEFIKKNDELEVDIEEFGALGEGVAKVNGYTLFINSAIPGDRCKIKVIKTGKNFGYGRLLNVIIPSSNRVAPRCPVADKCGGCKIMSVKYEEQLRFKQNKVRNNVERIGGLPSDTYEEEKIIGMEEPYEPYFYRNKAQFPVGMSKDGRIITGFYAGRTHSIIENDKCYIGVSENEEILEIIKKHMEKEHILPYDEKSLKGLVRHILIRKGFHTGEIMVCIVINGDRLSGEDKLVESLKEIKGMKSISLCVNKKNTNVILGDKVINLYGDGYIYDYIKDLKFKISVKSFFQVNPVQTERLYSKALEYAGLTGNETVWDLYCGTGTISLFLARKAKKVYGVEIIEDAIKNARDNMRLNGIENAEFYVGKSEEVFEDRKTEADVVVVDPPRKGCDKKLLDSIINVGPKRVVYVSCDSATLARDLKILTEGGYKLKKLCPVDMFPHSDSVESVCLLDRM